MEQMEPATKTMNAAEVHRQFSQLLAQVSRGASRVVVEQDGKPAAALVSIHDLERLRRYDEEREERFRFIDETRAAFADVPDDELAAEIDRAVLEAREELRQERRSPRSS